MIKKIVFMVIKLIFILKKYIYDKQLLFTFINLKAIIIEDLKVNVYDLKLLFIITIFYLYLLLIIFLFYLFYININSNLNVWKAFNFQKIIFCC